MAAITPESVTAVVAGLLAPLHPNEQKRTVQLIAQRFGPPQLPRLIEPADLKMTREALCAAQAALLQRARDRVDVDRVPHWAATIGTLIERIDARRPLGTDGKHGNLHTPHCGCEDDSGSVCDPAGHATSGR